jgi:uncharacterized RDD family membrane protein YckC
MQRKANGIKRLLAFLIDIIPLWLLSLLLYKEITGNSPMPENPWTAMTPEQILIRDAWLPLWILYGAIAECTSLRGTLGKKFMGIEVLGPHRRPLGIGRAFGRNFAKILSAIPLYLGFIWAFFSKSSNAWHDSISGCGVYERR